MNWYEMADAKEVQQVLQELLRTYDMAPFIYIQDRSTHELVRVYKYNYEIAEALWGEYSKELFD